MSKGKVKETFDKKKFLANLDPDICVFCNKKEDDGVCGKKISKGGLTVHYFCMLFSSGLSQNGNSQEEGILGFLQKDIIREVRRGTRLRCSFCKVKGATIGCVVGACRKVFHFGCGQSHFTLHQYFGNFSSFCEDHRPRQMIPVDRLSLCGKSNSTCAICMASVPPNVMSNNTIRAPCCGYAWFHRKCIQKHAMTAGLYFFKCPLCNNKDVFQDEMLHFGIYIPDQDAAWELEPGAYDDLLERYMKCDAMECKCPHGRKYHREGGRWEVLVCDWCGAQGTHVGCRSLLKIGSDYVCSECKELDDKYRKTGKKKNKVTKNGRYGKDARTAENTKMLEEKARGSSLNAPDQNLASSSKSTCNSRSASQSPRSSSTNYGRSRSRSRRDLKVTSGTLLHLSNADTDEELNIMDDSDQESDTTKVLGISKAGPGTSLRSDVAGPGTSRRSDVAGPGTSRRSDVAGPGTSRRSDIRKREAPQSVSKKRNQNTSKKKKKAEKGEKQEFTNVKKREQTKQLWSAGDLRSPRVRGQSVRGQMSEETALSAKKSCDENGEICSTECLQTMDKVEEEMCDIAVRGTTGRSKKYVVSEERKRKVKAMEMPAVRRRSKRQRNDLYESTDEESFRNQELENAGSGGVKCTSCHSVSAFTAMSSSDASRETKHRKKKYKRNDMQGYRKKRKRRHVSATCLSEEGTSSATLSDMRELPTLQRQCIDSGIVEREVSEQAPVLYRETDFLPDSVNQRESEATLKGADMQDSSQLMRLARRAKRTLHRNRKRKCKKIKKSMKPSNGEVEYGYVTTDYEMESDEENEKNQIVDILQIRREGAKNQRRKGIKTHSSTSSTLLPSTMELATYKVMDLASDYYRNTSSEVSMGSNDVVDQIVEEVRKKNVEEKILDQQTDNLFQHGTNYLMDQLEEKTDHHEKKEKIGTTCQNLMRRSRSRSRKVNGKCHEDLTAIHATKRTDEDNLQDESDSEESGVILSEKIEVPRGRSRSRKRCDVSSIPNLSRDSMEFAESLDRIGECVMTRSRSRSRSRHQLFLQDRSFIDNDKNDQHSSAKKNAEKAMFDREYAYKHIAAMATYDVECKNMTKNSCLFNQKSQGEVKSDGEDMSDSRGEGDVNHNMKEKADVKSDNNRSSSSTRILRGKQSSPYRMKNVKLGSSVKKLSQRATPAKINVLPLLPSPSTKLEECKTKAVSNAIIKKREKLKRSNGPLYYVVRSRNKEYKYYVSSRERYRLMSAEEKEEYKQRVIEMRKRRKILKTMANISSGFMSTQEREIYFQVEKEMVNKALVISSQRKRYSKTENQEKNSSGGSDKTAEGVVDKIGKRNTCNVLFNEIEDKEKESSKNNVKGNEDDKEPSDDVSSTQQEHSSVMKKLSDKKLKKMAYARRYPFAYIKRLRVMSKKKRRKCEKVNEVNSHSTLPLENVREDSDAASKCGVSPGEKKSGYKRMIKSKTLKSAKTNDHFITSNDIDETDGHVTQNGGDIAHSLENEYMSANTVNVLADMEVHTSCRNSAIDPFDFDENENLSYDETPGFLNQEKQVQGDFKASRPSCERHKTDSTRYFCQQEDVNNNSPVVRKSNRAEVSTSVNKGMGCRKKLKYLMRDRSSTEKTGQVSSPGKHDQHGPMSSSRSSRISDRNSAERTGQISSPEKYDQHGPMSSSRTGRISDCDTKLESQSEGLISSHLLLHSLENIDDDTEDNTDQIPLCSVPSTVQENTIVSTPLQKKSRRLSQTISMLSCVSDMDSSVKSDDITLHESESRTHSTSENIRNLSDACLDTQDRSECSTLTDGEELFTIENNISTSKLRQTRRDPPLPSTGQSFDESQGMPCPIISDGETTPHKGQKDMTLPTESISVINKEESSTRTQREVTPEVIYVSDEEETCSAYMDDQGSWNDLVSFSPLSSPSSSQVKKSKKFHKPKGFLLRSAFRSMTKEKINTLFINKVLEQFGKSSHKRVKRLEEIVNDNFISREGEGRTVSDVIRIFSRHRSSDFENKGTPCRYRLRMTPRSSSKLEVKRSLSLDNSRGSRSEVKRSFSQGNPRRSCSKVKTYPSEVVCKSDNGAKKELDFSDKSDHIVKQQWNPVTRLSQFITSDDSTDDGTYPVGVSPALERFLETASKSPQGRSKKNKKGMKENSPEETDVSQSFEIRELSSRALDVKGITASYTESQRNSESNVAPNTRNSESNVAPNTRRKMDMVECKENETTSSECGSVTISGNINMTDLGDFEQNVFMTQIHPSSNQTSNLGLSLISQHGAMDISPIP